MIEFLRDTSVNPFLTTGLAAGILASITCGAVGPYVVTRRLVFLAGALAHIAVGGLGAAIFLAQALPELGGWIKPIYGAAAAAVGAAPILAVLRHRVAERLDTVVGALWAAGMAVGILLIKLTPGYHVELMSYLFGNLAFVSVADLWLLGGLATFVLAVTVLFHRRFVALCLDPEHARLRGVPVLTTDAVLLTLVALAVICLTQVVGLILVIALLSIPAAIAGRLVARLTSIMWVTGALSALLTTVPRMLVYGTAVSPEAAIVLAATVLYLLVAATRRRAFAGSSR